MYAHVTAAELNGWTSGVADIRSQLLPLTDSRSESVKLETVTGAAVTCSW